jgi:hypothetical protein
MASLYISYFASVDKECAADPIKSEVVTTSTTSAASAAIPDGTAVIKINSDTAHYVTIGTGTPTAAVGAGSFYLAATEAMWLRTQTSNRAALKIAAVTLA